MTISFENSNPCANTGALSEAYIDDRGHLIFEYKNGTIQDLGKVTGEGKPGPAFKPDFIGDYIPTENDFIDADIGFCFLYIGNNDDEVQYYFKSNFKGDDKSTWIKVKIQGDNGKNGESFVEEYNRINDTDYTVNEMFNILKGKNGESTYQLWLRLGNVGTEDDFLESLKGEKGDDGIGIQGEQGLPGEFIISNTIDRYYENALLVIGICPAGYVVNNIEIFVRSAFQEPVNSVEVRFGGTEQSYYGSTLIAMPDYFEINETGRYILNEINHLPSDQDEIVSCVFNESVNNSASGLLTVLISVAKQLPTYNIKDKI